MKEYWYELTINTNRRPDYPEDNTIIVQANDINDALDIYKNNHGKVLAHGEVIKCRKIFYVLEPKK